MKKIQLIIPSVRAFNVLTKEEKVYIQNDIIFFKNLTKDLFEENSFHFYTEDNYLVYLKEGYFEYVL